MHRVVCVRKWLSKWHINQRRTPPALMFFPYKDERLSHPSVKMEARDPGVQKPAPAPQTQLWQRSRYRAPTPIIPSPNGFQDKGKPICELLQLYHLHQLRLDQRKITILIPKNTRTCIPDHRMGQNAHLPTIGQRLPCF